jgi:Nif-specific regulatory protein
VPPISPTARKRLLEHPWPGNIRELRNLMERLAYLSAEDRIDVEDLAFILSPRGQAALVSDDRQTLAEATDRFQIEYIRRLVEQCRGNMSHAASRLGLHRSNLYRKMRQLGMEIPRVAEGDSFEA